MPNGDADCAGGHRHHRTGQETEQDAVDDVVELHQRSTSNPLELVIKCESFGHSDRRHQKTPCQNRQQIAQQQPEQQILQACPGCEKQWADHEFGSGRMLSGIHAPELAGPE